MLASCCFLLNHLMLTPSHAWSHLMVHSLHHHHHHHYTISISLSISIAIAIAARQTDSIPRIPEPSCQAHKEGGGVRAPTGEAQKGEPAARSGVVS
ncbi:hypothetical protein M758_2G087500 [Ceratodon purpureus]|nr:hypothetical protein M758_2G087500 [Ceratodon purpureus]